MPRFQDDPVISVSNSRGTAAVQGESSDSEGVRGTSHDAHGGVVGINDFSPSSPPGAGGNGGWFESAQGEGVRGWAKTPHHGGVVGVNTAGGTGVYGQSDNGTGVIGESKTSEGVRGISHDAHGGVVGINDFSPSSPPGAGGNGGWFESAQGEGVRGWAKTQDHGGVVGVNSAGGTGVHGESDAGIGIYGKGGRLAGMFEGDVEVTGDIRLSNADCAEDFDVFDADLAEPGTVMVLNNEGVLHPSFQPYDKRVAGVVSGAGSYKPGLVLDRQAGQTDRKPIALLGKVYCKVDARLASIEVGDLLTTSAEQGYAMKASEPAQAFGAVIGKALRPLKDGQGLIPILIALQ